MSNWATKTAHINRGYDSTMHANAGRLSWTLALVATLAIGGLGACSSGPQATDSASATPTVSADASTSASATPTPEPTVYPSLDAPGSITQEASAGGVTYTSSNGEVRVEVPADWVVQTDGSNPLSQLYFRSASDQFLIVSNLGVPLSVASGDEYASLMTDGGLLDGASASYLGDVTLDGIGAWKFSVGRAQTPDPGATQSSDAAGAPTSSTATPDPTGSVTETARVYVFEYRGVAREITVHATDEAGYAAIETILTQHMTLNGQYPL